MRIDEQNRRSCIALLVLLALLAGFILWMSLGGVSSESLGDDVQGDVGGPGDPKGAPPPAGTTPPP